MSNQQNDEFEEAMQEATKEVLEEKKQLPEAPVSVTIRGYYKGYSVLATKRDTTPLMPLLQDSMKAIDWMIENGFKPSWADDTNNKVKPQEPVKDELTATCPIHNVPMTQKVGAYGNYWTHAKNENGTWFNCNGKGWRENIKGA
jgi:hypothetical protein